jgi:4-diphosphocytidyl-2-C-methyl-D-erythritol kinase
MENVLLNLQDEIEVTLSNWGSDELTIIEEGLPIKHNLVSVAVTRFSEAINEKFAFSFRLYKRIPIGGGLGGGSGNAAAVLLFLNEVAKTFNKDLPLNNLLSLALDIGADLPYQLLSYKRPLHTYAVVGGVGEEVNFVSPSIVVGDGEGFLIIPEKSLSTQEVFTHFKNVGSKIAFSWGKPPRPNSLIPSACALYPPLKNLLEEISFLPGVLEYGMSGSGSTLFVFGSKRDELYKHLLGIKGVTFLAVKTNL